METQRLGATATCKQCDHGKLISFNFPHSKSAKSKRGASYSKTLDKVRDYKSGSLYQCSNCQNHWYLDDNGLMMHSVDADAVPFLEQWSASAISLAPALMTRLREIGETPIDVYGNGAGSRDYPCGVVTHDGQRIDMALVSFRTDPPIYNLKNCRLASEIAEIYPSPHALPHDVRVATSQSHEMRMGFCPTLVKMADGMVYTLNWTTSFFTEEGYDASEVQLSDMRIDIQNIPPISHLDGDVTVFLADAVQPE